MRHCSFDIGIISTMSEQIENAARIWDSLRTAQKWALALGLTAVLGSFFSAGFFTGKTLSQFQVEKLEVEVERIRAKEHQSVQSGLRFKESSEKPGIQQLIKSDLTLSEFARRYDEYRDNNPNAPDNDILYQSHIGKEFIWRGVISKPDITFRQGRKIGAFELRTNPTANFRVMCVVIAAEADKLQLLQTGQEIVVAGQMTKTGVLSDCRIGSVTRE